VIEQGLHTTYSADETEALGRRIGESISGRAAILLYGELGVGKTLLTRGLTAGLGADAEQVSSPSFTLVNHYAGGRLPVYHLDLYRLADGSAGQLYELGLDEMLDSDAVVVIEWAEKLGGFRLPDSWQIRMHHADGDSRRIEITQPRENSGVC
jgi:tRNA threonylcarbamoyladenosine biosynthesis protein TsaE